MAVERRHAVTITRISIFKANTFNSGHFHADEALAVYLLRLLPIYTSSPLVRTRDPEVLSTCHTVVDVGGEYSPATNRYDHHQRSFDNTFPDHNTKLSSAGLVYMHFGKALIAQRTSLLESSPEVTILYKKLYTDFIEALDANDNGISVYDPKDTAPLKKRFNDGGTSLGSLVSDLNHEWHEDPQGEFPLTNPAHEQPQKLAQTPEQLQAEEDGRFLQASKLMGTTFLRKLSFYHTTWLPARTLVHEAYKARFQSDPLGSIIIFEKGAVPWKDHLYTIEATEPTERSASRVLYVLYPESPSEGAKWRVQCVSTSKESFESRKPLKEEWRGIRDEELSVKSGIGGCVFVHASGFIGGNKTRDGALEMAKQSMDA